MLQGKTRNTGKSLHGHYYRYRYPQGLGKKMDPNSKFHQDLVRMLTDMTDESQAHMSQRYSDWDAINNTLTAYIPTDEVNSIRKSIVSSPLIVPVSYANLQTLLTFMMSFFMNSPIFKYQGVGGDSHDRIGALLIEFLVHLQTRKQKMGLNFHTFFRDAYSLGMGVLVPSWFIKTRTVSRERAIIKKGFFGSYESTETISEERTTYEGNKLFNVDPYTFFPDPNVSISNIQDGEFYAYLERSNLMALLKEEVVGDPDSIFNVRYLKHLDGISSYYYEGGKTKTKKLDTVISQGSNLSPVDIMHHFVELIPSEIQFDGKKLGNSPNVELWLFSVAGDTVIIDARPIEADHGLKPIVTGAPDFDGYSVAPTSRLEMMYPLQDTMDWLFTSHIANVKKAINDMLVVDPKMVYLQDLMNPKPGKLVRLKKAAWGQGVDKAIHQLKVQDVTGGHIQDTGIISEMLKQVSAANDSATGNFNRSGERVSASEANNAFQSSVGRIQKDALVFALQAFEDLGMILASNTVQYMSNLYKYRLTGEWEKIYKEETGSVDGVAKFSPSDIDINFDVAVNDAHKMMSQGNVESWTSLFGQLLQNPEMAQEFDLMKIFMHIARTMGANNVHEFVKQKPDVKQLPTEEVIQQREAGNIVPVEEAF